VLFIYGEDSVNASTFTKSTHNISSRPKTASFVEWQPDAWNKVGESTEAQRTPDLKEIIQEIVDKDDWEIGNSIVILVEGSTKRVAESYDGGKSKAPVITIDYRLEDENSEDDGNIDDEDNSSGDENTDDNQIDTNLLLLV